jgi:enoyl-CoA hydratase/carnithine racemase
VTYTQILYAVRDRVATITLNRPDKLNAWTPTIRAELKEAFAAAAADEGVRAIIVTGAGRGFCAGADMEAMSASLASGEDRSKRAIPEVATDPGPGKDFDQPLTYPLKVGKPVIAAINGPVAGIGLCFTLYCDLRFIAAGAKVTTAFARRGLIAEYGSAWMLPRLIGPQNAADLLISGRTLLAEEAAALGLARLLPAEGFLDAVQAYAADLANNVSPRSMAVIKRQLWGDMFKTLAEACVEADQEMFASFKTEDFREGVAHFVEKRAPRFVGR